MSGSAPEEPQTSIPQSTASVPDPAPVAVGPGGSSEVSFGEQNLSFTTTDVSLVEMMEIEYTQLQHILYSHTEAQASEGEVEARLNSFSSPGNSADPPPLHQTSLYTSQEGCSSNCSRNQLVYPVTCQSGLPSDSSSLSSNPHLGYTDFQELRMMLLSESNLPLNQTDKTPNSSSVEVPGCSLVKVKYGENFAGMNKENILVENSALAPEPRSKSAVRVRLEDRFNSIQTENPRCQEPQESGVTLNNLVTLIRQPSELIGVPLHQQENKCAALGKNKPAPAPPSLQFTYPLFTMNACSTAGSANPSQAQTSGTSCTVLEAAKHQDLGIPRTLSFCYQEIESTKQTVDVMNKALPEEVWIKVGEDTLCKKAINRRSCSRISPLDPNTDRKPLGEIQNMRDDSQSTASAQGRWQSAQSNSSMQVQSGTQDGIAQRRERHNRMERDRRRRIRICCDELNLLVPFCTVDTDKATTLQWTTAFLKYIRERHGDSLKQEFESVFCGKTGRRLKIARSDSFVTCPVQENTHGYGDQVV
ncbi:transcription factor-like 5 protein isoform X3 [Harpia harpyja]|uniref:transcription factor-like 5 protein isoform X3 n=1 Tax=Harpia harpyja TaxID=202280 RepID=UPI0022B16BBE|nr:transcription factor-like 5 protein isoform X3 [Harpia harpyja]